jgi:hypothetical protein
MKEYENLSNYKFESFEKIRQSRFTSSIKYSEEPKVGETYKKGDVIEVYFDHNVWSTGTIEETYFGIILVNLVYSNNKS